MRILARGAKRRVERMRRAGDFECGMQIQAEDFLKKCKCGFFGGERGQINACLPHPPVRAREPFR